jgi:hypothetical protein
VPGFVVIDQPSRPYFPPDEHGNLLDADHVSDNERAGLQQYFDVLFSEISRSEGLQLLVLEHAFFASDPRYVAAMKYRWTKAGEKLVPASWREP